MTTGVKTLPEIWQRMLQTGTVPHHLLSPETNLSSVWWVPRILWQQRNVVLNTIVAEAFSDACDILEKAEDFDLAVHDLIKEYATLHQRIVFNGNGYSEEWVKEAKRQRSSEYPVHGRRHSGSGDGGICPDV